MEAIILNEAGSIDKLIYQAIEKPTVRAGEVLIKVKAIGVNPMDIGIRSDEQLLTSFLGSERPAILGWDVAGEVTELGPGVTGFEVGEPVFALSNGKGYAEYVAVSADVTAHKPENISYEMAAALPVAAIGQPYFQSKDGTFFYYHKCSLQTPRPNWIGCFNMFVDRTRPYLFI